MELDLSQSDEYGGIAVPEPERPREPNYPCLYLTCDGVENLPDSGTMKVKYRVKGRSSREVKGETTHSVDLELLTINCPKKQKDVIGTKDDEEALKSL